MKKLITFTAGLCFAMSTQAHMLWLERTAEQQTNAYFGEYSANIKETQQGSLKKFNDAKASQHDNTLAATIQPDHLVYKTQGTADVVVQSDLVHGKSLVQFIAKAGRQSTVASTELDIVPTEKDSNQLTVLFQGKPLAKQKVVVFSPQRWEKKYTTDSQGKFTIETPWQGQYIIETSTELTETGTHNEQDYQKRILVNTLSISH